MNSPSKLRLTVKKGKTLLVDGPASTVLLKGSCNVFGSTVELGEKNVIRKGKRAAFEVEGEVTLGLTLGKEASFKEIDGSTIPPSWKNAVNEIIAYEKSVTATVIGGIDSGKTSLCIYLANKALEKGRKVVIIDADLGQSDLGPPSTIGFSQVTRSVKDLFELRVEDAYFVGLTNPRKVVDRVIEGVTELKSVASETDVDILIVNTDGWIESEDATRYKVQLIEKIEPDIIGIIGIKKGRIVSIMKSLKVEKIFLLDSPSVVQKRSMEKRKILRELSYKKYLKKAEMQTFQLNRVKIEWLFKRSYKGVEEGLIVALKDSLSRFLGIGVLSEINHRNGAIKVFTPVREKVASISIGQIKLDKSGREIGSALF